MTRLSFALLATSTLAARVEVHNILTSFEHLSAADSLAANNALDILAQLKVNSDDVALQQEYRTIIGDVAWEEDRNYLATGMNNNQGPVALGEQSQPGTVQALVELLSGRMGTLSWFTTRVGRFFTGRRDFAIETMDERTGEHGETKYMIDGITRSLHSRMQVSFPNEIIPRFVVRRAFNYLNPIASTVGQYIYRVIRCEEEQGGWAGGCREGEMLYTITKDRFGRGALWGQDEYRVYTGTGGCWRHGHGVLSCDSEFQIMYSLSSGLASGAHDTNFYAGNIRAVDGNMITGRLHDGTELDIMGLARMQVATVMKSSGSPRALNYPVTATGVVGSATGVVATAGAVSAAHQIVLTATQISEVMASVESAASAAVVAGEEFDRVASTVNSLLALAPGEQLATFGRTIGVTVATGAASVAAFQFAYTMAWWYHLAKSVVWADSYHVAYIGAGGSTDELLIHIVAAVQDLTREAGIANVATR